MTGLRGRRPLRAAMAAMAALLAVGLLAGCGGGGEDAAAVVREAPDKTVGAGSARVALRVTVPSGEVATTVSGEGVVDLEAGRGALKLDLGAVGQAFGTGTIDSILDRSGIYIRLPVAAATGRPWVKLDFAALAGQAGVNVGSVGQLQSADPTQALKFLEGASSDMEEVGEEKIRGEDTTHYRGTVDLKKAAGEISPEARVAIESLGSGVVPVDVWLDDEGRVRKMSFQVDPDGTGPATATRAEFEMYDFGVDADVQVPPADQVTDLSSLLTNQPNQPR